MTVKSPLASVFGNLYPYKDRLNTYPQIPKFGRSTEDIITELSSIAAEEDKFWETGLTSGTMYHGGKTITPS